MSWRTAKEAWRIENVTAAWSGESEVEVDLQPRPIAGVAVPRAQLTIRASRLSPLRTTSRGSVC